MTDRNVEAVRNKLAERAATGLRKYGTTTERKDLTPLQWFQHLQDELMDAAVYVEVLMRTLAVKLPPPIPPDHGAKLNRDDDGIFYFTRRVNGVRQVFYERNDWEDNPIDGKGGDGWSTKAAALRALAKATGYEIKVEPCSGLHSVQSGGYGLTHTGFWDRDGGTRSFKFTAEALARDCEARGHYPAEMCDRGEVEGNG